MSRRRTMAAALALALLTLGGAGVAQAADGEAAQRARLAADRQAVQARYDADRRDCATRFLVSQCLEQARRARHEALLPLQREGHLLDDARRRLRAAERLHRIETQQSAAAAQPALGPTMLAEPASAAARLTSRVQQAVRTPAAASAAAQSAAQAATQHRAAQQQRLRDAQAHQAAVQARNARQDAHRPPAASLPIPALPAATP